MFGWNQKQAKRKQQLRLRWERRATEALPGNDDALMAMGFTFRYSYAVAVHAHSYVGGEGGQ